MMCKNWGFCDLSINRNFDLNKLNVLAGLGFHTVAINTVVEESDDEPKKKKKKGESNTQKDFIVDPVEVPEHIRAATKLNILQRVTIEFSDSSITPKLNKSENLKKYDIVAVVPKTTQAFQYACGTFDCDLISFQPESRLPYKITRKLYRQACERNIFFELMYSPAIKDSTSRKNIICVAHTYHAVGKCKNIVLTSGADTEMFVRDAHDVINLGFIFGLNNNQTLEVIRDNTRKLIVKAIGRKSGKLYVDVSKDDPNKMPES